MKKLPKRQIGAKGRGDMGITYFEASDSHYILYLDNIKSDEEPSRHQDGRGGYFMAYKIDDITGNYSKHPLYNSLKINDIETYQFKTSRIVEAEDNILLVEVYIKGKKDMMIKMELIN
jgi:hypothetical protein